MRASALLLRRHYHYYGHLQPRLLPCFSRPGSSSLRHHHPVVLLLPAPCWGPHAAPRLRNSASSSSSEAPFGTPRRRPPSPPAASNADAPSDRLPSIRLPEQPGPQGEGSALIAPLLASLSEEQAAVVLAPAGAALRVVAGPGSGKTRVLTTRLVQLIEWGLPPWKVLAITFTNKAARELKTRLQEAMGEGRANMITSGTFHSVAQRMLRKDLPLMPEHLRRGLDSNFKILDSDESIAVLKDVLKIEFVGIESKKIRSEALLYQKQISAAKNSFAGLIASGEQLERCFAENVANHADAKDMKRRLGAVFERYDEALLENNAVDFDNLLALAVEVLRSSPEVLEKCRRRWPHIMVDEFQDTNGVQYEFVRLLACESGRIFVVGDPDQAIYGWRGARVDNMVEGLDRDFAGLITMRLRDNYRSGTEICRAADAVITTGVASLPGRSEMKSKQGPRGNTVTVIKCPDEQAEAAEVAQRLTALSGSGTPLDSCAVLFRNNSQARALEAALIKAQLPYVLLSGVKYWSRTEVKDLVAYLRLAADPTDNLALLRVINVPSRKVGLKTVQKMAEAAESRGQTLAQAVLGDLALMAPGTPWAAADQPKRDRAPELLPGEMKELGASAQAQKGLSSLRDVVFRARAAGLLGSGGNLGSVLDEIVDASGYLGWVREGKCGEGDVGVRESNVKELRFNLVGFEEDVKREEEQNNKGSWELEGGGGDGWEERIDSRRPGDSESALHRLRWFLSDIALQTDEDTGGGGGGVQLMTIHASKGLEFDTVFLTGCEEDTLPKQTEDPDVLEEERRLFYVGVTRAKRNLFVSWAAFRRRWGNECAFLHEPSRFILDMRHVLSGTEHPLNDVSFSDENRRSNFLEGQRSPSRKSQSQHHHASQRHAHRHSMEAPRRETAFGPQATRRAFDARPSAPGSRSIGSSTSNTPGTISPSGSGSISPSGSTDGDLDQQEQPVLVGGRRQKRPPPKPRVPPSQQAPAKAAMPQAASAPASPTTPQQKEPPPRPSSSSSSSSASLSSSTGVRTSTNLSAASAPRQIDSPSDEMRSGAVEQQGQRDQLPSGNIKAETPLATKDPFVTPPGTPPPSLTTSPAGKSTKKSSKKLDDPLPRATESPAGISAGWIALLTGTIPTSSSQSSAPPTPSDQEDTPDNESLDKEGSGGEDDSSDGKHPRPLSLGHHIGIVLSRRLEVDRKDSD